jgi:hypothetical protein
MPAFVSLAIAMMHPAPLVDEVWIGNYKTPSGSFIPHAVGTTQELDLRADGTCRITTRNHHLLGGDLVEATREGTYSKDSSLITFELVKDGKTTKHIAELQPTMMIFDGLQAPFNFSKPCIFTPVRPEAERTLDGKYKLSLYDRKNQQYVSLPETLTIASNAYSIASDRNPTEATEKGTVSSRKLANGKVAMTFKGETAKAMLNDKSWIDLYNGEVWTVPNSLAIEFPDLAKTAGTLDLILLEKMKPALLPK